MSGWRLRYAAHLGFPTRATPWLAELVRTRDVADHIARAAALGFAGMADKDLVLRPVCEQQRIGAVMREHGLTFGSFVEDPSQPLQPWADDGASAQAHLRRTLSRAIAAGQRAGGGFLVVTAARDPAESMVRQLDRFARHLRTWALDLAEAAGVRLCVEAISPLRLDGALVTDVACACALADRTDGRLGVIFDTVHVAAEGQDLGETFERARGSIAIVQLADMPGRVAPGTGTLDLASFLAVVEASTFGGLVELEHGHAGPNGSARTSLAHLAALDATIMRRRE